MNELLQLKGQFQYGKSNPPGPPRLPKGQEVTSRHLRELADNLRDIKAYWTEHAVPFNPLVTVVYGTVVAKSNRIRRILGGASGRASDFIVGARFEGEGAKAHHEITHCVPMAAVDESIAVLDSCASIVDGQYGGAIDDAGLERVNVGGLKGRTGLTKSAFAQTIRDSFYAKRLYISSAPEAIDDWAVVSIYDTGYEDLRSFLADLGLQLMPDQVLGSAVRLDAAEYAKLAARYPFLVSMAVSDISTLTPDDFSIARNKTASIPAPGGEPIIGVLDTPFDDRVYFADWVEACDLIPSEITIDASEKRHGTAVSSIIVDGPSIVPELDDGCGRFRVRHFGVATGRRSSAFSFMRNVRDIVEQNRDIKVWNISQGSVREIARNFMSPEGATLDELQSRFDDIVFVVAGTNQTKAGQEKIGAPADSINSLVVNATSFCGKTASYARQGPVLDFFKKPDVCAIGGDSDKRMPVCTATGQYLMAGTSFAAPWIARKMAYLMQVMGFTREVAKALIIDSAAGWDYRASPRRGYGQVPVRIEDVVQSCDDEIKFTLTGTSEAYATYNYGIPVPIVKKKHPYIARVTLCYFPQCDRRQGVDYTSAEMDLHFGRINDKGTIQPLDNNRQGEEGFMTTEGVARKNYRKWDNVKHIGEEPKENGRERKAYSTGMWGIKIRATGRGDGPDRRGRALRFGVVVTLREINGANRIDDFIQRCSLRGWIVNRIDVRTSVDIYSAAEVDIDFDE